MTCLELQSMRDDPQLLSGRLSAFVRPFEAKALARMIDCDVRTAENIRRGHWPIARHWAGLVAAFGRDLTDAVFHPSAAIARLEQEVIELERELAERRAALAGVAGSAPGQPRDVARVHQRAAEVKPERRAF